MEIKQHFVKNNDFKTVPGSGVFGGITNSGLINMVIFTERVPLPENIILEIDDELGTIKREVSRDIKEGTMRELQMGVLFDIETAKATADWLNSHVESLKKIINATK
jgi:hypothetical protein